VFLSLVTILFETRFGNMGLQWKELPPNIGGELEESLLKNIKSMNEVELSCFMKGSVAMGYEWNKREKVKEMIFKRFNELYGGNSGETASGRGIASIVYNWGETELKWEELSPDTQNICYHGIERYASSFNPQIVTNIIFG
jgi:hypothetical protein